ncbi:MAG: hypothetical protein ACXW2E_01460 [Nitrososphaeraceae archaeon]
MIDHKCVTRACNQVGDLIRDSKFPLITSNDFIKQLTSKDIKIKDPLRAGLICKHLVRSIINQKCTILEDEVDMMVANAIEYSDNFCNDPKNSYLMTDEKDETVQVLPDIETKVIVNKSGKIKKGGKQILAKEMFLMHVINAEIPMSNQDFQQLLIKELKMTFMGSNTYLYNLRKEFGLVKPKTKKKLKLTF